MWWRQKKSARSTLYCHLFCRQSLRFWSKDFLKKSMNVNLCKRKQTGSALTYTNVYIIFWSSCKFHFTSVFFMTLEKSELRMNSADGFNMSLAPRGDGGQPSSTRANNYWGNKEENKKDPKGSFFFYIYGNMLSAVSVTSPPSLTSETRVKNAFANWAEAPKNTLHHRDGKTCCTPWCYSVITGLTANVAVLCFLQSTSPSHSVHANMQSILHMMKHHQPQLCQRVSALHRSGHGVRKNLQKALPASSSYPHECDGEIEHKHQPLGSLSDLLLALQDELGQMSL